MFNIVLVEPQIPPNTGNVIRLAANTGARLHLVAPLGFTLDHKQLRRAGLDYLEFSQVAVHASFDALLASETPPSERMFAFTTRGTRLLGDLMFAADDWFVFGNCSRPLCARLPHPFADASRKPQPEPVERGRDRRL